MNREEIRRRFDQVDTTITHWMAGNGLVVLRVSLGIVFLWFGALKLVPGLSPEEELVRNTTYYVNPDIMIPLLSIWEMIVGLGLVLGRYMRFVLLLLFLQMPGTALPLIVMPEAIWTKFPYGLTLEGQYIIKNMVLLGAGLVLGGTVRGGRMNPEPHNRRAGDRRG